MEAVKETLVQGGIMMLVFFVISVITAWVKKGQFEGWGKIVGRWLSKVGNVKLGKTAWEKIEDVLTLSILSFAKGVKLGADEDDNKNIYIESEGK